MLNYCLYENSVYLCVTNNQKQIKMNKAIRIDEMTHEDAIKMANQDSSLMCMLGGSVSSIMSKSIEDVRSFTLGWFKLNSEVGAFYGKSGF